MNKLKIINFPRFDEVSDSFIDGPLPQTADAFFTNNEAMKQFFEIKPFKHEQHHDTKQHH
jgi:hypothetical protein